MSGNHQLISLLHNEKEIRLETEHHLLEILAQCKNNPFNEWLIFGYSTASLIALTNASKAFLMYMRAEGDPGFSSRSSKRSTNETESFLLSNGQIDEYPKHWLVEKKLAEEAIIHYFHSGERYHGIDWYED